MAQRGSTNPTLGGAPLMLVGVVGVGFQFRLSSKLPEKEKVSGLTDRPECV